MPYLYGPLNADGTMYDPPLTTNYIELLKNFPPCHEGGVGYLCAFCDKCPHGDYFVWPEIALPILEEQKKAVEEYNNEHRTYIDSMYFPINPEFKFKDGIFAETESII